MSAPGVFASGRLARVLLEETRGELLKQLRLPAYVLPSIAFPSLFYTLFGLVWGASPVPGTPIPMSYYLLATYGTFGVVGAAMFGLGVGVATERGQGWLAVKRASPMPPLAYFSAKIAMSMLFGVAIGALLALLAVTLGEVRMGAGAWLGMALTLVLGAVPFCAMGCALGFILGPNSAPAVVNLVYLPMSLASGLWIPIDFLPSLLRALAPWLPTYHLAEIALHWVGGRAGTVAMHVAALALFAVLFTMLATLAYRHDRGKTYG